MVLRWLRMAFWFAYGAIEGVIMVLRDRDRAIRVIDAMEACDECPYPESYRACDHHGEMFMLGLEPEDYGETVGEGE